VVARGGGGVGAARQHLADSLRELLRGGDGRGRRAVGRATLTPGGCQDWLQRPHTPHQGVVKLSLPGVRLVLCPATLDAPAKGRSRQNNVVKSANPYPSGLPCVAATASRSLSASTERYKL
jgi:hypothetical protein